MEAKIAPVQINDGGKFLTDTAFRIGYAAGAYDAKHGCGSAMKTGITICVLGCVGGFITLKILETVKTMRSKSE